MHDSFEEQFENVQVDLQFEQPYWGKPMTENFAGCHNPMAEYMDKLCSGNGWLCLYSKDQSLYHNLFPLSPPFIFLIKHEEKFCLWDHLLDSMEKHIDILFETFVRNQVLNSDSLD